jgi:hypothetical protein
MKRWTGRKPVAIVTACRAADGNPDFALTAVMVTYPEFSAGCHYNRAEEQLHQAGFQPPFIHYDREDAPAFLFPAVKEYLGSAPGKAPQAGPPSTEES